jgi:hypothetical protein
MIKQVSKWVGVAAVALAASTSVQAQNVTLRFSNWLPPTHPMVTEMLNPWAKDVEQATEGRVKIQVLPPLGTPASHYDLVRNGVADMTIGVHSYTPERFKLTEMVELPMTAENAQVNSLAYWRTYQKYFMGKNEHAGTKLLGAWVPGSYQLWTAAKVDSGLLLRSLVHQLGQLGRRITFIQQVTAHDQVVALPGRFQAQGRQQIRAGLLPPLRMNIGQIGQAIQSLIQLQKMRHHGVAIAGVNLRTPFMHHQTGQAQATAQFQNAFIRPNGAVFQFARQLNAGWPHKTKQRPDSRAYTQRLGVSQRVGILHVIGQGTNT